jgi:hypothetical protein
MKTLRLCFLSSLFLATFGTSAFAQNSRTFVSGTGLDTNPCSLTSPCRTFGQAISVTNSGGEVIVLTSAGYGPFTINKAVTVEAPAGVYAGITVTSGNGITINAGPMDTVILRGLTVDDQGAFVSGMISSGIVFNAGGTLQIESCITSGFNNGDGIEISGPGNFFVKDTISRGNNFAGIAIDITAGTASVAMDHVHLDANAIGLFFTAGTGAVVSGTISNSSASGNSIIGVEVQGLMASAALDVESCVLTNNDTGVSLSNFMTGTAMASISNCTISNNPGGGFTIGAGGTLYSRGQNTLIGNGANFGSPTPLAGQ